MLRIVLKVIFLSTFLSSSALARQPLRIPDEYQSVGGHSMGLGHSGAAALGGISAVRLNPGLLPLEDQYSINAGYNWPSSGRAFYQLGVVDTTTSKSVAAGLIYTNFTDDYKKMARLSDELDSPVKQRVALAVAHAFEKLSLGISAHYLEAYDQRQVEQKGVGIGFGAAALISPVLRVGASAENLNNGHLNRWLPRTLRGGIAYLTFGGDVSLNLDYRERERVADFEGEIPILTKVDELDIDKPYKDPERMLNFSCSARVYDVLRLLAAYGQSTSTDRRQTLAGGIGLAHQGFSISYDIVRPYLSVPGTHSGIHLSLLVSLN